LATRKNHQILNALTKKGFEIQNSKHIKATFYYKGKKTGMTTWISHGKKEISDRLMGIMADQLKLEKEDFENLVDCNLSESGLIQLYIEREVVI